MAKQTPDIVNQNPLLDTSETTADAFVALKNKGFLQENQRGIDDVRRT